jgi:hypothetical protein
MNKSFTLIMILGIATFILYTKGAGFKEEDLISIYTTLGSAVIGGLVAFYTAHIQIKSNKNIEELKNLKLERNICILVSSDLSDIRTRFTGFLKAKSNFTYGQIKTHINLSSLEKFKIEFINVLNEEKEVKLLSSVINRLQLMISESENKHLDKEKTQSLIVDVERLEGVVNTYLDIMNEKMR